MRSLQNPNEKQGPGTFINCKISCIKSRRVAEWRGEEQRIAHLANQIISFSERWEKTKKSKARTLLWLLKKDGIYCLSVILWNAREHFRFPLFFFQAVKFLSALAADGTIPDVEAIISSNLSAGFDSVKESVSESIARQEKILAAVQVAEIVFRWNHLDQVCTKQFNLFAPKI